MAGMSIKKINVVDVDERQSKSNNEAIMWKILEESRPCMYRMVDDRTRFCDALNRILHHGMNKNKSIVTPEKCAECEFSDNRREKPVEKA